MYKVIVIDDEMLVRRGIVMETDWQALNCVVVAEAATESKDWKPCGNIIRIC
mgnify:FL=1